MRVLTDSACLGRITDASLCHSWAGLLTITSAIADDSAAPDRFIRSVSARGITLFRAFRPPPARIVAT
ncbi:glycoside hydrolase family protein [Streptosporangium soli]|nr:hypothetical protein [Streptosporangium sp. KLBMP 9127]